MCRLFISSPPRQRTKDSTLFPLKNIQNASGSDSSLDSYLQSLVLTSSYSLEAPLKNHCCNCSSKESSINVLLDEMKGLRSTIVGVLENYAGTELIAKGNIRCGCTLLQMAASEQLPTALYNLGVLYERGHLSKGGVPNIARALICYQKASKLGHGGAKFNLAVFLAQGKCVKKDTIRAKSLIYEAALMGLPQARAIVFSKRNSFDSSSSSSSSSSSESEFEFES